MRSKGSLVQRELSAERLTEGLFQRKINFYNPSVTALWPCHLPLHKRGRDLLPLNSINHFYPLFEEKG